MRAAELISTGQFRLAEMPDEAPRPDEVQVRVRSVGICGSDIHYYAEGGIGDTPCVYPMVLGHEPAGEVVRTGAQVSGWSKGDVAALEPALYCYHCEFCQTGHHNVCANLEFLSTPSKPGFFREFVNIPAANLLPLPKKLSLDEATLFEPLSVVIHSMRFARLAIGETAAVFGGGPIGLLTVAVLKLAGASRVWCIEPLASRRELALAMGADAVVDPKATDPVREILKDTKKRGVDVTLDCASKDDTINQSMDVTRSAGRVVITGIPSETQISLNFHVLRRKELLFSSVRRSNHTGEAALHMLGEHSKLFAPLITHSRPLDRIQDAFEMLVRYEDADAAAKVVVHI